MVQSITKVANSSKLLKHENIRKFIIRHLQVKSCTDQISSEDGTDKLT